MGTHRIGEVKERWRALLPVVRLTGVRRLRLIMRGTHSVRTSDGFREKERND